MVRLYAMAARQGSHVVDDRDGIGWRGFSSRELLLRLPRGGRELPPLEVDEHHDEATSVTVCQLPISSVSAHLHIIRGPPTDKAPGTEKTGCIAILSARPRHNFSLSELAAAAPQDGRARPAARRRCLPPHYSHSRANTPRPTIMADLMAHPMFLVARRRWGTRPLPLDRDAQRLRLHSPGADLPAPAAREPVLWDWRRQHLLADTSRDDGCTSTTGWCLESSGTGWDARPHRRKTFFLLPLDVAAFCNGSVSLGRTLMRCINVFALPEPSRRLPAAAAHRRTRASESAGTAWH
ncbi:hypothetical protein PCL_10372 [Purpureocillium lilacinum]|uniref:Uncharacterized protein n=1 Tax=Purpureocillium lilacinum TaxID=33203 RepID=A0A2U3EFQ7_PURLI|nr:hypothetical protein Purlil1_3739 [Purpureocillium lilacinum]PWI73357.1 hypothetical protein PCL_10372 [Purpureocillium lilacinum]